MWILRLAMKNLWRNKSRTLIAMAAIYFAVLLCTLAESLKAGIFNNLITNIVSRHTGHIRIQKAGYQKEQVLDNSFTLTPGLWTQIMQTKHVEVATPRIESFGLASSKSKTAGCLILGILPETEIAFTGFDKSMMAGTRIGSNERSAMPALGLAQRLGLGVGDTIMLISQGYQGALAAGKYRISGIFRSGVPQLNDKLLYLPLEPAQEFFDAAQQASAYVVNINRRADLNETKNELSRKLGSGYEVLAWEELLPDVKQHIEADSRNMRFFQAVLYLLVALGILSTQLLMMMERRYETGLLLAIGMNKRRLMLLFVLETLLTVFSGCLAGLLTALPVVAWLKNHPIRMSGATAEAYERFGFEPVFPASDDFMIFMTQTGIVLIIGILLSAYPLVSVMRLKTAKALRK